MKKKLRNVEIKGTEWSYVIDYNKGEEDAQVRIYKPGTKQILKRVPAYDLEDKEGRITPAKIKLYIETKILTLNKI
jgi:hypothetical protein